MSALYFNESNSNTAVGERAFNTFNEDTGDTETFDSGDVDAAGDTITIAGHGWTGSVNLKYTEGTSAITGLTDGDIDLWKVVDIDNLVGLTTAITDAGSGTAHTFTHQHVYTNATALGYNAEPDASNQVVLGDANVTEVRPGADNTAASGQPDFRWSNVYSNIFTVGDTTTGDADGIIYFADDGSATAHNFRYDDGLGAFTASEGVNYAADAQADDDYEVAIPGITALTAGLTVTFLANTANTDGATLEITSVGDLDAILKMHDQALATGDIEAGQIVVCVFDGSNWQMVSQLAQ